MQEAIDTKSADWKRQIRARYLKVDTSNVADVLDAMDLPDRGLAAGFHAYVSGANKLAGWAYTIRGQTTPFRSGGDAEKMEACNGIGQDEVSVWSGDGSGVCYFGELIALGMREKGCVGALVNGGIRDLRWLSEFNFPVFAKYRTPVQSIGRWKVNACQVPVFLDGATSSHVLVAPGDFILGDEDGVIAIPQEKVEQVLIEAERLTDIEMRIRAELSAGLKLSDALLKFGHV